MKKTLSEAELQAALASLDVGQQTIDIARGVLVEGRPQADFVGLFGLSRGAVSQAVSRVWAASGKDQTIPPGYERVTVVLPERQAFIVKGWAKQARDKRSTKE